MTPLFKKNDVVRGKYEVLFPIHQTTFGESYRVKSKSDGKLYMLKIYKRSKLHSHHFNEEQNLIEAEFHKDICHTNISKFHDCTTETIQGEEYFCYTVDYVSGEKLIERIEREGAYSETEALFILEKICQATKYLHNLQRPIIHGDISPLNILIDLTNQGNPILFDFGLSREVNYDTALFNRSFPSIYFCSNNILKASATKADDVYSICALLYYLVTTEFPWSIHLKSYDINSPSLIKEIIDSRNQKLHFPNKVKISEHLKAIIARGLNKDSTVHFQSIEEFLGSLNSQVVTTEINTDNANVQKAIGSKSGDGLKKVVGMHDLKTEITNDIIEPLRNPELGHEYGIEPPNAILFYGPPGCGKTFFAQCLAEELGYNFFQIAPSDVASIYVHGGQGKIKELFDSARENAPSIIFIDEIDAMIPDRSGNHGHHYESEVNEWLIQLNNCSKDGILVIGATNRISKLDKAVLRSGRFDRKILIPLPDFELRKGLFESFQNERAKVIQGHIDCETLAKLTNGFIVSDISLICMDAARQAFRNKEKITQEVLESIIKKSSPSISEKDLDGFYNRESKKSNTIGFKHYDE